MTLKKIAALLTALTVALSSSCLWVFAEGDTSGVPSDETDPPTTTSTTTTTTQEEEEEEETTTTTEEEFEEPEPEPEPTTQTAGTTPTTAKASTKKTSKKKSTKTTKRKSTTARMTADPDSNMTYPAEYYGDATEEKPALAYDPKNGNEFNEDQFEILIEDLYGEEATRILFKAGVEPSKSTPYDIKLSDEDGNELQILEDAEVAMALPFPEGGAEHTYYLYHVKRDGAVSAVDFTLTEEDVEFMANDVGYYILTWGQPATNLSNTASEFPTLVVVCVVAALASIAAAVVVIILRRRQVEED